MKNAANSLISSLHLDSMLYIFFPRLRGADYAVIYSGLPMRKQYRELADIARRAREFAYAPYSNFRVGAALLARNGRIFTGCNVENSSYGLTICAERTAIFKAYSEGIKQFSAIAVVSDDPGFTPPCGACRQVLMDLAGNIDFIMADRSKRLKVMKVKSLLPSAFTAKNLIRNLRRKK
jgi:cytidine deaminase